MMDLNRPVRGRLSGAFAVALVSVVVPATFATAPQLGGEMKHMFVTLAGNTVFVSIQGDPNERVVLRRYDESYDPPADVLNGAYYSGRYGWLAQGFWTVPTGKGIFVEVLDQTEGLRTFEALTFSPLFGTSGGTASWRWSTVMVHNWYAVDRCGKYEARYRVYVGDLPDGTPTDGFESATITLRWQVLPEAAPGDLTDDGDVTIADFAAFQRCFTGADTQAVPETCGCADFDGDDDIDLVDADAFVQAWNDGLE